MKVSRRSFFGFMGGAAASGPSLAKGLAADASSSAPGLGFSAGGMSAADEGWKRNRIKELRKLITGGNPDRDMEIREARLHQLDLVERFRLDGLRSIAPAHKARMFNEGALERSERARQTYWERELSQLTRGIL